MYEEQTDESRPRTTSDQVGNYLRETPNESRISEVKRKKQDILREYEITLRFLSGRGMIVRVGCKEIAFEDTDKGMEELTKYIENPFEEGKKWNEIFNQ